MGRITVKEFWDMADNGIIAAIHCNTKEKAKKLLAEFDKMGKYWVTGTSYRNKWWNTCKDETCYDNEGRFNNQCYYRNMGNIIYEFEDIIFDDDKTVCIPMQKKPPVPTDYPKIAQIRMSNGKNYYYALYDVNIKRSSFVLVTGIAAEKILEVTAVYDTENRPEDCPENLTQEVIGEINMKPYRTRVKARRTAKREKIKSLNKELGKLREKLLQDFLNQNEEYKSLKVKLEELKNV